MMMTVLLPVSLTMWSLYCSFGFLYDNSESLLTVYYNYELLLLKVNKLCAGDTICLRPVQVDNIFAFIR